MDNSFPVGASLPASVPASESAQLERWYRRLVACYPRSFRSQNMEEIIGVLLATAHDDQRRPSLSEAADLLRGAARMRMGMSRSPWTVRSAVRLMWLGAVGQLAVLITTLLTADHIRAAVAHHYPTEAGYVVSVVNQHIFADELVAPCLIAGWLGLAWAAGKGCDWSRPAAVIAFLGYTVIVLVALGQGTATYAPVAFIAAVVVVVIGLAAVVFLVAKPSWAYYERQPVSR
jgi:hypothetical protein